MTVSLHGMFGTPCAPSTTLRVVPLPLCEGEDRGRGAAVMCIHRKDRPPGFMVPAEAAP